MSKAAELAALIGSQSALSNRNLIINGAMQVAQRGTSSTSSGIHTVDRFSNSFGTVAITQTQDTTVPSGQGFSNSYKNEVTTASSSTAAYWGYEQRVEAQDIRNSGWDYTSASSYITLSFWARSSVAGTYMCGLRTSDGTQYNISSQYTLVADTWKKVEVSFPGNSNLTINNDNGTGLSVYPVIELGSNYTSGSSFDTWTAHSSSTQTPDANINFIDTLSATFFVTGVQLEVGEQATPFEHRSFGDELARCQRYAYVPTKTLALTGQSGGFLGRVIYPVTMRSAPALTLTASAGYDNSSAFGNSPEANEFTITNVNSGNGVSFSTPPTNMIITEQTTEECMIGFSGASTPNEEAQNPIYSVKFGTGAFMLLSSEL